MAQTSTNCRKLPILGWADVRIVAVGQNAIGVVAIAGVNATGVIAIGGVRSNSALPVN